jgi:ABC-type sugar transport system permease subunit
MAEDMYPALMLKAFGVETLGLLSDANTQFATVMIYSIFVGFGPQVLMYSGAMSGISDSIVEAGQLDGISPIQEFFKITIPMIWPTVTSFIVVNLANVFVNQMQLFSFYGAGAEYKLYTLGYYLYSMIKKTTTSIADYPYLSAFGLVLTLFTIPATMIIRKLLERLYRTE